MQSNLTATTKKQKPFILSSRHEEILREVFYYRYMRLTDVMNLFFKESNKEYAGKVLALLSGNAKEYPDLKYLYRMALPDTRKGQSEYAYTLGTQGRKLLEREGYPLTWSFRTSDYPSYNKEFAELESYSPLKHALTLTSVMIASTLFTKNTSEFELREKRIEYDLRNDMANKKQNSLKNVDGRVINMESLSIPDAFFSFYKSGKFYTNILCEVDRATEYRTRFKKKVQSLARFIRPNGAYSSLFGADVVTIGFITTGDETRLRNMQEWTKQALGEIGKSKYSGNFFFRRIKFGEIYMKPLFLEPVWYTPGERKPVSLLDSG